MVTWNGRDGKNATMNIDRIAFDKQSINGGLSEIALGERS